MGTLTNLRPRITRFNLPRVRHFAIAAALLWVPALASAQRLAPEFARLAEPWSEEPASRPAAVVFGHPDDHRWEGALVGGAFVGLLGAALFAGICGGADSGGNASQCLAQGFLGFLAGGAVGGLLGGLLGAAMPKDTPDKPE